MSDALAFGTKQRACCSATPSYDRISSHPCSCLHRELCFPCILEREILLPIPYSTADLTPVQTTEWAVDPCHPWVAIGFCPHSILKIRKMISAHPPARCAPVPLWLDSTPPAVSAAHPTPEHPTPGTLCGTLSTWD